MCSLDVLFCIQNSSSPVSHSFLLVVIRFVYLVFFFKRNDQPSTQKLLFSSSSSTTSISRLKKQKRCDLLCNLHLTILRGLTLDSHPGLCVKYKLWSIHNIISIDWVRSLEESIAI
mmetsp:Transcript_51457/g.57470  ORF Transcript_51457/g.57470 Transcript_51457/m.57470 type:complete len:116 (-) Transcript_51457:372-719(-)